MNQKELRREVTKEIKQEIIQQIENINNKLDILEKENMRKDIISEIKNLFDDNESEIKKYEEYANNQYRKSKEDIQKERKEKLIELGNIMKYKIKVLKYNEKDDNEVLEKYNICL